MTDRPQLDEHVSNAIGEVVRSCSRKASATAEPETVAEFEVAEREAGMTPTVRATLWIKRHLAALTKDRDRLRDELIAERQLTATQLEKIARLEVANAKQSQSEHDRRPYDWAITAGNVVGGSFMAGYQLATNAAAQQVLFFVGLTVLIACTTLSLIRNLNG